MTDDRCQECWVEYQEYVPTNGDICPTCGLPLCPACLLLHAAECGV